MTNEKFDNLEITIYRLMRLALVQSAAYLKTSVDLKAFKNGLKGIKYSPATTIDVNVDELRQQVEDGMQKLKTFNKQ